MLNVDESSRLLLLLMFIINCYTSREDWENHVSTLTAPQTWAELERGAF